MGPATATMVLTNAFATTENMTTKVSVMFTNHAIMSVSQCANKLEGTEMSFWSLFGNTFRNEIARQHDMDFAKMFFYFDCSKIIGFWMKVSKYDVFQEFRLERVYPKLAMDKVVVVASMTTTSMITNSLMYNRVNYLNKTVLAILFYMQLRCVCTIKSARFIYSK